MPNFPVRRSLFDLTTKFPALAGLLLAVAALLAGCHPAVTDPTDPKFIVAEKGNWKITRGDLNGEINDYLKQHNATLDQVGPANIPRMETAMLKNMVLKKLLMDKAASLPLQDVDKDEAAELAAVKTKVPPGQDLDTLLKSAGMTEDDLKQKIHEKVLIGKVLQSEAFKNVDPTEQEIDDIYLKNKASFVIPEKVRASRVLILVDDKTSPADKAAKKKEIDKAHDRVTHGEDFSKVATEVSQDRYSAPRGGDINFFQRGENEPGFDEVAFSLKQNEVSPVFLTPLGYQFLKITAIQPAGPVPIADARAFIASKLREMKMEQQEQAYAKQLMADSGVTYHLTMVETPPESSGPTGAPGADAAGADSAPPAANSAAPAPDASAGAPPEQAPAAEPAPASAPATNGAAGK
jgi:parvulin-like peptidyl-prolyl isomerase